MLNESTELIVVQQLPIISEQLRTVKAQVEERVSSILSLVCTEDTYKEIKKERAALGKEYAAFEQRRKAVKAEIMAPYEQFEAVYKECVGDIYTAADAQLKIKIAAVENGIKAEKEGNLRAYFVEYRDSIGLPASVASYSKAGIKVTLTSTDKALREAARGYLDGIKSDLQTISTMDNPVEYRAEYLSRGNLTEAIAAVNRRRELMKQQEENAKIEAANREAAEKIAAVAREAALAAPIQKPAEPKLYTAKFTARGTIEQLKKLKAFMDKEGIKYE